MTATAIRYHVNPETNRPNQCKAKIRCDFAVDGQEPPHFETKEEARKHVEGVLTEEHGETTSLTKETPKSKNPWVERKIERAAEEKAYKDEMLAEEEAIAKEQDEYYRRMEEEKRDGVYQYTVTEANYDKAINSIEAANRKLEKAGINDRFEYEMEEKQATEIDALGRKIQYTYYLLKMNRPSISYENNGEKYKFLAAVSRADAGYVTRTASGVDLKGWRPDNLVCDHCGQKRTRNKTYIVEGPDGKRMQIGSACVDVFLGAKPAGLWAMSIDPIASLDEGPLERGGPLQGTPKYESKDIMAMALAVTGNGEYYISKAREEETGVISTASRFSAAMFQTRMNVTDPIDQEYFDELDAAAERYKENGRSAEVLEQLKNIEGTGDYIENVRTLARGEFIKPKDTALLISGIAALNRIEREKNREKEVKKAKEEKIAEFTPGHFGKIDDKIEKGTIVKLHSTRNYTDTDYWGNQISKTVITAKDEEGHMVTWFTGVEVDAKPGDDLTLSSGKVKKHSNYQGVDQTMLGNVRLVKKKN